MIALDQMLDRSPSRGLRDDAGDGEIADALDHAAAVLDADPDAAALLLDGLVCRLAHALARVYAAVGARDGARDPLGVLDHHAPDIAYRLRLALRAPDVRARLVHCQQLCQWL
jgi:hypothetical protein